MGAGPTNAGSTVRPEQVASKRQAARCTSHEGSLTTQPDSETYANGPPRTLPHWPRRNTAHHGGDVRCTFGSPARMCSSRRMIVCSPALL